MFENPNFWVLIAFIGFIVLLVYLKVPGMIISSLDVRAKKIKADLDEADTLLKDAQDLLASYQKKQRESADEAERIKAQAREEAENTLINGNSRLQELLQRREQLAMDRIKQSELAALDKIRSQTADIALEATHYLLLNKEQF